MGPPPNPPSFGAQHPTGHRLVSTPLRGTASPLAHRSVSGSNTICNGPSPPLADIVLFGLPLKALTRQLGEGFHTLINGVLLGCFVHLPNQCGRSQSNPLRAQRPYWHSFLSLIDVGPPPNPPPLGPNVLTGHRLVSTPFGEQPPCWPIVRCLALIPLVTAQIHR